VPHALVAMESHTSMEGYAIVLQMNISVDHFVLCAEMPSLIVSHVVVQALVQHVLLVSFAIQATASHHALLQQPILILQIASVLHVPIYTLPAVLVIAQLPALDVEEAL